MECVIMLSVLVVSTIVIHAVWRIPFVIAVRPRKCRLERGKQVKQRPRKNHKVVHNDPGHYKNTCIADT